MAKLNLNKLADYRKKQGLNQRAFWFPLGVTQAGGSRYETGRKLPLPVALLLTFRDAGKISDTDLNKALTSIKKARAK